MAEKIGGGVGFMGAALLLGVWLWWDGHIFSEWSLFVVSPAQGQKFESASSIGNFKGLGACRVAANVWREKRSDGALFKGQRYFEDGVWFCGLNCEVKQIHPDGSASQDPANCRRLEPAF